MANAMSKIYLFSVSSHAQAQTSHSGAPARQAVRNDALVVRAGYFGLCANHGPGSTWTCASDPFGIRSILGADVMDPMNAIGVAAHFKNDVVFPGLLYDTSNVVCEKR